ncbi:MAG: arginase family protein [Proteobacteria bacterium]|nr:arginase family protein [Pseudomonadota bacterium]
MREPARNPVVIDLDGSVGPLPGATILAMQDWQEAIRFGCSLATLRRFGTALERALPRIPGTVFMGSGDFHHLSWPLIARLDPARPIQVIVFDNHPDNMRFPFGVHCGSWVRRVAALPHVDRVHVIGITSRDIGAGHAWENYLTPLLQRKLDYWSIGVDTGWAHWLGIADRFHDFAGPDELVAAFTTYQREHPQACYLSIDKDVFDPDTARTNWDQGRFRLEHALAVIDALAAPLVGSDVNGEISRYEYRAWWKRRLSALDDQPVIDPAQLAAWQAQQHAVNLRLLEAIAAKS